MANKIKPRLYKGTRDFLPDQMVRRDYVINIIKNVFQKYGFEPLETPTLELWETLSGKYGEEGDRLTYRFIDYGKREVGLRYDLTVPLSRVIAMYPNLPKPFKRYQIQPVWRAEKPQKGRFREFYQCDIDIIGSQSVLAEAEILTAIHEILKSLQFQDFLIRFNSRKILSGIGEISQIGQEKEAGLARAIDKLEKIGEEGVLKELVQHGIVETTAREILQVLSISGTNSLKITESKKILQPSETGLAGIEEIDRLLNFLQLYDIPEEIVVFDLNLARGLDYYTGPIFEFVVKKPKIGSIAGGGRYDKLIGLFSGHDQPATGCSIGLERMITVMDELGMFPKEITSGGDVLVTVFDENSLQYSVSLAHRLRRHGIRTDLYSGQSSLRGQFGLANDKNIPLVIIAGPDEIDSHRVTIKNMMSGKQRTVPENDFVAEAQKELKSIE